MGATHTTEDGYTLTIIHAAYMDYGLRIEKNGETLFYNPCCLSNDSYGSKPSPEFDDWEEAEEASLAGDDTAFIAWTDADWVITLKDEAYELVDAFVLEQETP